MTGKITIEVHETTKNGRPGQYYTVMGDMWWSDKDKIKLLAALIQVLGMDIPSCAMAAAIGNCMELAQETYEIRIPRKQDTTETEGRP